MDEFCGSKFWDWEITWNPPNGTTPDFTPCFEKTALVWGPCGFLWLFAIMDILYSVNSVSRDIPRSPLSVSKYGLTYALIIAELIIVYLTLFSSEAVDKYYPADYTAASVKIASYVLFLVLLYYSRKRGVRSSGVQFIFWLLNAICEAIRFRTSILAWQGNVEMEKLNTTVFFISVVTFLCIAVMLSLSCCSDIQPQFDQKTKFVDNPCPEEGASYLSRMLFHWFSGLALNGFRKPLQHSDLWDLNIEDKSRAIVSIFDKNWNKELKKIDSLRTKKSESSVAYTKVNGNTKVDFTEKLRKKEEKQYASILPALIGSFGSTFFFASVLKLIPDFLTFVSPQILKLLIAFTSSNEEAWKGIFYAVILFFSAFLSTTVAAQYSHRMYLTGMRMRTALVSAIYRKALLVSNSARRESTVGEIVNLMSVDVQKIMDLMPWINMLWSAPLQIGLAIYFLWGILGPSALAGLGVMILLVPVNAVIVTMSRRLQIIQMKKKDMRVKMMNEIISQIKILKLYAWESCFEEQIMKIRREEMEVLKKAAYVSALLGFVRTCTPFLVAISTFSTYVLIDSNNVLDAQKAFVSLSLFNIINMPLAFLPVNLVLLVQAGVSLGRLNKFMNADEIDPDAVSHDKNEVDPIVIENGSFSWEQETTVLKDINLKIKDGSLVAVVGTVGAGKSTLLSAILGELDKLTGRVNTKGSIAYVSQQAWIQNSTLRDNIIFGRPFDSSKYDKIVDACALKPDLEILPAGDKTEIGEKGINLSGGQKQRVSLARAVYNNADIYLLDDPLSAVDSHVGKHIFDNVLGPNGMLKRKTRVLVTHGIGYLSQVDNIIVMTDGEVSEMGTYRELLDRNGTFAEFLNHHTTEEEISELNDLELIKNQNPKLKKRNFSETSESETTTGDNLKRKMSSTASQESIETSSQIKMSSRTENDKLIDVEKSETESVKIAVYLDYFRAAGWHLAAGTVVLFFCVQASSIGSNLWLSEWSNQPIVNGTQDPNTRNMYLGIYGTFGVLQAMSILGATLCLALGTLKSASTLHFQMLRRIIHAPMAFFDTTPVGRIVNRFAKDVDVCDNDLPFNLRMWFSALFNVVGSLTVISYRLMGILSSLEPIIFNLFFQNCFYSTPTFIAVIIPVGLIYYLVQRFYVSTSRQLKRLESVTRSPIYSHFSETITGASTIRAYSEQERFILESEAKVDYNQVCYFPIIISLRWLSIRLDMIGNIIIFFAALFAVLGRESLSSGLIGLSVSYALQITMGLNMLVQWTSDVETNIVAVERLKEYWEASQEAPWEVEAQKPTKTWPERGEVRFDHYQTRYRPGLKLVLKNVTCTINPGEKVGIVGRTGAGKSSLTLALFRIIEPANGSIVIDGQNISKLGLHDLRGRITIIPQDPVLFSGNLRINLDPFEQHSDEFIWHSLELAHLKRFVKTLPAGLQHEISEGGENLSVGQRQLVCLARALLRKTKILVLDEATSSVDLEMDDLIQQTIRTEFRDSTVITIAHRLNTIMDSTRVMVLDKGEIVEFDRPGNLLDNKGSIFSSMAKDAGLN